MKMQWKCPVHVLTPVLAGVLWLMAVPMAGATGDGSAAAKKTISASVFDTAWALPVLYSDKGNPVVQKLALIGRYHGQYYAVDADEFGSDDDWDHRRARLGIKAELFHMVSFEGQMNIDADRSRSGLFDSVEDLYVDIRPSAAFGLSIGKYKPYLTREWNMSSNRIKTMERSLLVSQIVPDKIYGVTAFGRGGPVSWRVGTFSATYTDRWELPDLAGGYLINASLGYDVGRKGQVRLDYLYNDGDRRNFVATKPYEHSFSLNYSGSYGSLGVFADLIYATGSGQAADVWGVVLIPYYTITERLEGVFRYTYAGSNAKDGIRLASRYERRVDELKVDRGDDHHAFYLGANYYIYGDKLKVMTGVEYTTADLRNGDDWDCWTWIGGVRISF